MKSHVIMSVSAVVIYYCTWSAFLCNRLYQSYFLIHPFMYKKKLISKNQVNI